MDDHSHEENLKKTQRDMEDLVNKHVYQKRAYLMQIPTISVTVIAGVLAFMSVQPGYSEFKIPAIFFVISLIITYLYLALVWAQESLALDRDLLLIKESRQNHTPLLSRKHKSRFWNFVSEHLTKEWCFLSVNAMIIFSFFLLLVALKNVKPC